MALATSRLIDALVRSGMFPSLCTVQVRATPTVYDDYGHEITAWNDLHVDVACATKTRKSQEPRTSDLTYGRDEDIVILAGYYSDITVAMQAIVDGETWNITGVDYDPVGITTYLYAEKLRR